jgi:ABC-type transporter Mla subunit MlaD
VNRSVVRRRARRLAVLGLGVLLLAGCGFRGAYSVSLPGGADVGDDPYTVRSSSSTSSTSCSSPACGSPTCP